MITAYFFATPLIDYSKLIKAQANTETKDVSSLINKHRKRSK